VVLAVIEAALAEAEITVEAVDIDPTFDLQSPAMQAYD